MKFAEINAIFTQKVAEYIAQGYTINTNTMAGHQGEIGKIDLRKGEEVIRVLLDTEHFHFREAVVLIVGRNTDERVAMSAERGWNETIWNNRLEIIEKRTFWQMQKNYREVDYYLEGESGEQAMEKSRERAMASRVSEHHDRTFEGVEKLIAKAVRRHLNRPGFKSQNVRKVWKSWSEDEGRYFYKVQTLKHTITLG